MLVTKLIIYRHNIQMRIELLLFHFSLEKHKVIQLF